MHLLAPNSIDFRYQWLYIRQAEVRLIPGSGVLSLGALGTVVCTYINTAKRTA